MYIGTSSSATITMPESEHELIDSPQVQASELMAESIPESSSEPMPPEQSTNIVTVTALMEVSNDLAKWTIDSSTINFLLSKEINQNLDKDFSETKTYYPSVNKHRSLTRSMFQRTMKNGQTRDRKYLRYSPSKKAVFCIPCHLFGDGSSKLGTEGSKDWSNVLKILDSHEKSREHIKSCQDFSARKKKIGKIDTQLEIQIEAEFNYWKNVLRRVIAVVKKLSSRGLSFRGKIEKFGSVKNANFMMALELISEFDPFLANHIAEYGNPGSGQTSYLSSTICEEFISLIGTKVREIIIAEVKSGKYFSIIVDSTPDISHVDELALVLRYVPVDKVNAVERFLKFLPNVGHKAKEMYDALVVAFTIYDLNFQDCRGQSYDNAANMSGCYEGLQALLTELNAKALYVPCGGHALNLVGKCTVESNLKVGIFFDYLEDLYNFLTVSTGRWELLLRKLKPNQKVVKRVTGTRWSCRYDAVVAFMKGWKEFMEVLNEIEKNKCEKSENQRKAAGFKKNLSKFESVFIAVMWTALLERFDKINKILQAVAINLRNVIDHYKSLMNFVTELRTDEMFQKFLNDATEFTEENYEENTRSRRPTLRPGESRENQVFLSGQQKLRVEVYYAVLDKLKIELERRCSKYEPICERFNFLINICDDESLSAENLTRQADDFQTFYDEDIEDTFSIECLHFRSYIQESCDEDEKRKLTGNATNLIAFLKENNLEILFPNVVTALQVFLCMALTNCSAERAFSCLKRIKNYLRSTISEYRLDD